MTSSATQTERPDVPTQGDGDGEEEGVLPEARSTSRGEPVRPGAPRPGAGERLRRWAAEHPDLLLLAGLLLTGWVIILSINAWYLGAPVVFLCLGWLGLLLTGRAFWSAAITAGEELDGLPADPSDLAVSATRREDLEREKKALLKAIKEVEFDREMGKMSESDAAEIVRIYRARAIEILKELDREADRAEGARRGEAVPAEPLDTVIEREVRARMALAGIRPKKKPGAKGGKPEAKADAKPEAKADAKAEAKPEAKADAKPEAKADAKPEAKADAKPEAKAEKQTDAKPGANADDAEPTAEPTTEAGAKPAGEEPAP